MTMEYETESGQQANAQNMRDADVAIIGMACRFPGADTVGKFWDILREGRETTSFFTDEELLNAGVDPALIEDPNYVRAGQILPDVEHFDADRFKIPADEARSLDPQQRHFLECALEAFENAGYDPANCHGPVGVYAGAGTNTYLLDNLHERYRKASAVERYQLLLANDKDYLATRVSYKLNLRGPSFTVSTACSTSLVAVHLACLSLLNGECEMALAGGVHIKVPQVEGYLFQEGMIYSPDGHCRAFDASARGTIVGNGAGAVVLKRLRDALADGDWIHAVIKGTSINNDGGAKNGYTAPSVAGQAAVISDALALAECDAGTISHVEAHGTGTALGDPIEVAALTEVFSRSATRREKCALGSVKTNLGHMDTAAGMAGLIKTCLMLKHRTLVPSLHFTAPNPEIDFAGSPFQVQTSLAEWPNGTTPRRAGVSAFGIGGTNAHVVVEEAPLRPAAERPTQAELLLLSARSPDALDKATQELARHLMEHPELDLADVAYTLDVGRRAWSYRRALVCSDRRDAAMTLALGDPQRLLTGQVAEGGEEALGEGSPGGDREERLHDAARRWIRGTDVDRTLLYDGEQRRRVPLPSSPFERQRHWIEPEQTSAATAADLAGLRHQIVAAEPKEEKLRLLVDFMQREVAYVLGPDDSQLPDPEQSVFDMDVDSLTLIEVAAKLTAELKRPVSPDAFADHYSLRAFGEHVLAMGLND